MDARPAGSDKNAPSIPHAHSQQSLGARSQHEVQEGFKAARLSQTPMGVPLRREHSDGEIIGTSLDARFVLPEFQNGSSTSEPTQSSTAHQDGTVGASSGPGTVQDRDVAADLRAMREEIRNERSHRRRSSTYQSSRGPGEARVGGPTPSYEYPPSTTSSRTFHPPTTTDLNRPLPRRPSGEYVPDRRSREIVLPRWQPDAEVTECPICHTTFGFWYRKHHCRKCGRVVCAVCSPHRITIPVQFIVHAPEDTTPSSGSMSNDGIPIIDLTGDDNVPRVPPNNGERPRTADYRIDPALGGGQEVRLCNPCVPDPNPLPHSSYYMPNPSPDHFASPSQAPLGQMYTSQFDDRGPLSYPSSMHDSSLAGRARYHRFHPDNMLDIDEHTRLPARPAIPVDTGHSNRRHSHQPDAVLPPSSLTFAYGSAPGQVGEELIRRRRSSHHTRHRQHASLSGPLTSHSRPYRSEEAESPIYRPVVSQPQLREEDECPICHGALPLKGADGSETAREAHVSGCIETNFSTSAPRNPQPHPSAAVDAAVMASAVTPSQARGAMMDNPASGSSSLDRTRSTLVQQRRRTTGMVVYHATEKDCVGEDGGEAECVICFEEFSVGNEMGRLECLCKFHKVSNLQAFSPHHLLADRMSC